MKNTSNALRRVMSVVLVFAMMFTSMPTGALAEDVVDPAPSTTAAEPAASETTEPTTPEHKLGGGACREQRRAPGK